MAGNKKQCCQHDHVGDGEMWLTVGELADLIADGIDAMMALPADATRAERRSAMRARLDEGRARDAAPVQPSRRERLANRLLG